MTGRAMSGLGGALLGIGLMAAGCEVSSEADATSGLTVSPASVTLSAASASVVKFTVTGGDSNYTWSASSSTLGTLYDSGGTALYQSAAAAGTNTITVVDATGNAGQAVIVQE